MVSIKTIFAGFALFGATALAKPLERRQLTCILDPTVTDAVTCVLAAAADISDPSSFATAALGCIEGLGSDAVTCVAGILASIPGLPPLPSPL